MTYGFYSIIIDEITGRKNGSFCNKAARAVRYDSDFIWQTEPWPVREYILSEKDKNAIKLSELRKF